MANMNWEATKDRNGRKDAEVPDLKLCDVFLFEGEEDTDQGHYVTDIFTLRDNESIIIQYCPEWTPVCNEGMFHYGKMKFRIKKSAS